MLPAGLLHDISRREKAHIQVAKIRLLITVAKINLNDIQFPYNHQIRNFILNC